MASPECLPFDRLLMAVSADQPCGPPLRDDDGFDALFQQIRDLADQARRAEKSLAASGEGGENEDLDPTSAWRQVEDKSLAFLEQSKDTDIVAALIDALVRRHGFVGVRDGLRLYRECVERFWEHLFPQPEPGSEDDGYPDPRCDALNGLDGGDRPSALVRALLHAPIVECKSFGVVDYEQAESLGAEGGGSLESFRQAQQASSRQFISDVRADIEMALEELRALADALIERCGFERSASTSNIESALRRCLARHEDIFGSSVGASDVEQVVEASGDAPAVVSSSAAQVSAPGAIATREQAFQAIEEIARFFRETEPHSVLSWQLDECVRWGRMSLPDLFAELIGDDDARRQLFERTGLPRDSE